MSVGLQQRVRHLAGVLDASPSEVAGLALLCTGGLAATLLLWVGVAPSSAPAAPVGEVTPAELVPAELTVHVAGAVLAPGVVRLTSGARVADAVAAAGGASGNAALDELNLARLVEDGERIVVPDVADAATTATPDGSAEGAWRADGRLDLNLATQQDLEQLPGIGPVTAGRILDWREANGGFREVAQLREVTGIGERRFQDLAPLVVV